MNYPIILLDIDGVVADFVGAVCNILEYHGFDRNPSDFVSPNITDTLTDEEMLRVEMSLDRDGFARRMSWCSNAQAFVRGLRATGDVYAVTKPWEGSKTWCYDRIEWLVENGDIEESNVIFAHDKSLVYGDVFIEDTIDNLVSWKARHPKGLAVLIDQPWNQGPIPDSVYRARGLADAFEYIRGSLTFQT